VSAVSECEVIKEKPDESHKTINSMSQFTPANLQVFSQGGGDDLEDIPENLEFPQPPLTMDQIEKALGIGGEDPESAKAPHEGEPGARGPATKPEGDEEEGPEQDSGTEEEEEEQADSEEVLKKKIAELQDALATMNAMNPSDFNQQEWIEHGETADNLHRDLKSLIDELNARFPKGGRTTPPSLLASPKGTPKSQASGVGAGSQKDKGKAQGKEAVPPKKEIYSAKRITKIEGRLSSLESSLALIRQDTAEKEQAVATIADDIERRVRAEIRSVYEAQLADRDAKIAALTSRVATLEANVTFAGLSFAKGKAAPEVQEMPPAGASSSAGTFPGMRAWEPTLPAGPTPPRPPPPVSVPRSVAGAGERSSAIPKFDRSKI